MKRVMIIGPPGSGKTTLAHKLAAKTGLPLYHVDRLFFTDNWQERLTEEFARDQAAILAKPEWILDGNAVHHLEPRAKEADTLILLNPPRILCLYRMLKRRIIGQFRHRPDRPDNSREKLIWKLLVYMWQWNKRYYKQVLALRDANPHLDFVEITRGDPLDQLRQEGSCGDN